MVAGAWGGQTEDSLCSESGGSLEPVEMFGRSLEAILEHYPKYPKRLLLIINLVYVLAAGPSDPTRCTCPSLA